MLDFIRMISFVAYVWIFKRKRERERRERNRQTDRECEKIDRERYLIILSLVSIQHYKKIKYQIDKR